MKKVLVASGFVLSCSLLLLGATEEVRWSIDDQVVQLQNNTLTVEIDSRAAEYFIGVSPVRNQAANTAAVKAAQITFKQPPPCCGNSSKSIRPLRSVDSLESQFLRTSPGRLTIGPVAETDRPVAISIRIPPGTKVKRLVNHRSVIDAAIQDTLVIRNDQVLPGRAGGLTPLIRLALAPGTGAAFPDSSIGKGTGNGMITRRPDGLHSASPKALASRLKTPIAPVGPKGMAGTTVVDLVIDENGRVASVTRKSGPDALLAAVEKTVGQWQFEPFLYDNNRVSVRATTVFLFSDSGVASPVLSK